MKALRKTHAGVGNLELLDVPDPEIGNEDVLIAVRAVGICGTDIHILQDEFPTKPPVTLGHEISGEIVKVGAAVQGWEIGDRVIAETYYFVCNRCRYCRGGFPNLCEQRLSIGSKIDGGFAQYISMPSRNLHRIPESLSYEMAALTEPLACTYNAIQRTGVHPGEWVVVSGPGPIGLLSMQVVKAAGARVIAVGIEQDAHRLEMAQSFDVEHVVNVAREGYEEAVSKILGITDGGAPLVLECSGAGPSVNFLLDVVRKRGRYAQIGLFGKPIAINMDVVCYKELVVTGTNATVPESWEAALSLLEMGFIDERTISDIYPLNEWESAFDAVLRKGALKVMMRPGTDEGRMGKNQQHRNQGQNHP